MIGRVVKPISQPLFFRSSTNDTLLSAVSSKQGIPVEFVLMRGV
jgi:hypothetical protein